MSAFELTPPEFSTKFSSIAPIITSFVQTSKTAKELAKELDRDEHYFYREYYDCFSVSPSMCRTLMGGSGHPWKHRRIGHLVAELTISECASDMTIEAKFPTPDIPRNCGISIIPGVRVRDVEVISLDGTLSETQLSRGVVFDQMTAPSLTREVVDVTFNSGDVLRINNLSPKLGFEKRKDIQLELSMLKWSGLTELPEGVKFVIKLIVPVVYSLDEDNVRYSLSQYVQRSNVTQEEPIMSDKSIDDIIRQAARKLVETDDSIASILAASGLSQPDFYREFRILTGTTPTEYREKERARESEEVAKVRQENAPFDFAVSVCRVGMPQPFVGSATTDNLSHDLSFPIVVNEHYNFQVEILTTSGKLPTDDVLSFLKSEYGHRVTELVLRKLKPFFVGRLDIAYLQTVGHAGQTPFPTAFSTGSRNPMPYR